MASIELRVRDLKTGNGSVVGFDSEEAASAWLAARPKFTDVLGVAGHDLAHDVDTRLRAALRPLDAEELALEKALDEAHAEAARQRSEAQRAREQTEREAHKAALRTADPNRPMEVHWMYGRDMELTDPADERPIPDEAREAVLAWVRERDDWVRNRGQIVGDAKVSVWPGPVPAGAERVRHGTFVPVTDPNRK